MCQMNDHNRGHIYDTLLNKTWKLIIYSGILRYYSATNNRFGRELSNSMSIPMDIFLDKYVVRGNIEKYEAHE